MSAPHVSAAVALLISLGGPGDPDDIAQVLRETAQREGNAWDEKLGWGELDVTAAAQSWYGPLPNGAPDAIATVEPTSGKKPLEVTLKARDTTDPDGNVVSYEWAISGADDEAGAFVQVTLEEAGEYEITLTATDQEGLADSDTVIVEVFSPESEEEEEDEGCGCGTVGSGADPGMLLLTAIVLGCLVVMTRRVAVQRAAC